MTPAVRQEKLELGRAFGAPYTFLFPDGQGSNATTAAATANRGAIWIGTEMGGSGTVTRECLRICEGGTHRVLRHLGVWRGAVSTDEAPAVASRLLTHTHGTTSPMRPRTACSSPGRSSVTRSRRASSPASCTSRQLRA